MTRKVLIDGDILAYRAAFSTQGGTEREARAKVDDLMQYVCDKTIPTPFASSEDFHVYLTGRNNFRHEVAKTAVYKGNRKRGEKPAHLEAVREHIIKTYPTTVAEGEEADDAIAIEATKIGKDAVIASIDKDFLQVACTHYNFTKDSWTVVEEFEGLRFFYSQILSGDAVDNIIGLFRVGPKTSADMLKTCRTEQQMFQVCLDAYMVSKEALMVHPDDIYSWASDRVIENARLLWLRRYEGQMWEPPLVTYDDM